MSFISSASKGSSSSALSAARKKLLALGTPAACTALRARSASHVSPLLGTKIYGSSGINGALGIKRMSHVPNYEEKYRTKLLQRAQAEGVSSIDELKQKVLGAAADSAAHEAPLAGESEPADTAQSAKTPKGTAASPSASSRAARAGSRNGSQSNLPPGVKTLDQIMKLEMLESKTAEQVGQIWTQYHSAKNNTISACIPTDAYASLLQTARKNPLFVLPLPRAEGIEFFFMQFDHHQVHFTSLIEYKTNTVNARPYLTLTHYTDLMESHGVVLMRGEVDEDGFVDAQNAQLLALQMQRFYLTGSDHMKELVRRFNHDPQQFSYEDLIAAAEKL
ncbi:hypothetical protein GGI07_005223 [Coemansia sp. Benny D115]|nr:hypothetical protein GGI07_005223 [Coemansia sp. Benny D115]